MVSRLGSKACLIRLVGASCLRGHTVLQILAWVVFLGRVSFLRIIGLVLLQQYITMDKLYI